MGPPPQSPQFAQFKKNEKQIQLRVGSVLKQWMDNYWEDFDHELTQRVVDFAENMPAELSSLANQLKAAILKRVKNFPFLRC